MLLIAGSLHHCLLIPRFFYINRTFHCCFWSSRIQPCWRLLSTSLISLIADFLHCADLGYCVDLLCNYMFTSNNPCYTWLVWFGMPIDTFSSAETCLVKFAKEMFCHFQLLSGNSFPEMSQSFLPGIFSRYILSQSSLPGVFCHKVAFQEVSDPEDTCGNLWRKSG